MKEFFELWVLFLYSDKSDFYFDKNNEIKYKFFSREDLFDVDFNVFSNMNFDIL